MMTNVHVVYHNVVGWLSDLFLGEGRKRKLCRDRQLRRPDVLLHVQVGLSCARGKTK